MQFIGERDLVMFYYRHLFRLDMELYYLQSWNFGTIIYQVFV